MTTYASPQGYFEAEQNYQQQRVEQATPLELTCILYEGAIQAVEQGQVFLKRGDILARGRAIARAQGIILELSESLDRKRGGEFASRLGLLYDYMLSKLGEAHSQQLSEPLEEVHRLLKDLYSAWQQITPRENRADHPAEDAQEARIDCAV